MRRNRTKKSKVRRRARKLSQSVAKGRNLPEMPPKVTEIKKNTPKALTGKQETVAVLVAEDRLTNAQIAHSAGVSPRSLDRWKGNPAFRERVLEIARELSKEAQKQVIAGQERRLAAHEQGFGADAEIRRIEERLDRQAALAGRVGRVVPVPPNIYMEPESPEQRQQRAFEEFCYGPKREPQCLSFDLMHRHSTSISRVNDA